MWQEFKKFVMRGNVVDLAVAVIIGATFGAIIKSLTDDIIMPLVGMLTGGLDLAGLSAKVGSATLAYGKFLQAVLYFLIIAFVLFLVVKAVNKAASLRRKEEDAAPPKPSDEVVLLGEIRDLLKK